MRNSLLTALLAAAAALAGCAGTTPIRNLALPPVTVIEGSVASVKDGGFTLADASGSIFVAAKLPGGKKLDVAPGEHLKVFGNLRGGEERVFDGYVIRKPSAEQIIVSEPGPHFGFILQTRFR